MTKAVAEQSNALRIFWLKKHGYLDRDYSRNYGSIKWTYGDSDQGSSIGFSINRVNWGTPQEKTYTELTYTHTDSWSGEKEDMRYEIELAVTPCNYGGVRYWFICPLTKNGQYCGRRIGVLYSIGKWFGCRNCGNIAYYAQMQGGRFRGSSVSAAGMDRLEKQIKRYYYNGKPTRKYRRLMKMDKKLGRDLMLSVAHLYSKGKDL